MNALVAHYHELGLKGRNREFFEKALIRNVRRALRGAGYKRIRGGFGRVMVDFFDVPEPELQAAAEQVARIFGVAYVGLGTRVTPDMEEIATIALQMMTEAPFDSFRVRARRTYSTFEQSSNAINVEVGQRIKDATGGRVDLKNADATAWIELFGNTGIVYRTRLTGPGGLPVGVSGKMIAMISGGIDSPVAAWLMAKRGAEVELVHFHGQPFTDPSSVRQVSELAEVLTRYQLRTVLHLVPIGDAQRAIVTHAPAPLRMVLYRRLMLRIAGELASRQEADAVITGDSLGQVASQTIQNIRTIDDAEPGIQMLRPLIGFDKQEIVDRAMKIGTYEISTRNYQDCCVLFAPRSPATRTRPSDAATAEQDLDVSELVGKALAAVETRVIELPPPEASSQQES
ncbi:MAG: tRNA uracil 4-sulfurtransferase [Actinomycetota bacterium]|jgi:thiamine biosynthesis protein ThiI|nr:tRNA uracil 4-sulfurtransferase [Actinomycetota bacterium]